MRLRGWDVTSNCLLDTLVTLSAVCAVSARLHNSSHAVVAFLHECVIYPSDLEERRSGLLHCQTINIKHRSRAVSLSLLQASMRSVLLCNQAL